MSPPVEELPRGRLVRWLLLALAVAAAVGLYFRNAPYAAPVAAPPASTSTAP